MITCHIRLANKEDVPIILNLNREGLYPYKWTYDKKFITKSVSHGNYYVICDEEILGGIKFYQDKRWLWISAIAVFKKHRGKGYGKQLMQFAVDLAKKYGYHRIRFDTFTVSRAGKFYERLGYQLVEQGPYYGKKYRVYEKSLK